MQSNPQPVAVTHADPLYAIKTWRYLRLAMVGLVVGLGVSIAVERSKVHPGCFQTSISAYYYTPVRAYLVAALIGVGVCLVCLRGSTPVEDVLLSLAGMFASVVALVPTPNPGSCASALDVFTRHDRDVNIANNVTALLTVGALALLISGILTARSRTRPALIGYAVAVTIWVLTALIFWADRDFFTRTAHHTAAVLMFLCIVAVAVNNALDYKRKTSPGSLKNRYAAIAGTMVATSLVILVAALLGWQYWIIAIEATLLSLFAVFFGIQTSELWRDGLRQQHAPTNDPAALLS